MGNNFLLVVLILLISYWVPHPMFKPIRIGVLWLLDFMLY